MNLSAGKALCRFCGDQVPVNRLSEHISKEHPRPPKISMAPTLIRTRAILKKPAAK